MKENHCQPLTTSVNLFEVATPVFIGVLSTWQPKMQKNYIIKNIQFETDLNSDVCRPVSTA